MYEAETPVTNPLLRCVGRYIQYKKTVIKRKLHDHRRTAPSDSWTPGILTSSRPIRARVLPSRSVCRCAIPTPICTCPGPGRKSMKPSTLGILRWAACSALTAVVVQAVKCPSSCQDLFRKLEDGVQEVQIQLRGGRW